MPFCSIINCTNFQCSQCKKYKFKSTKKRTKNIDETKQQKYGRKGIKIVEEKIIQIKYCKTITKIVLKK